MPSIHSLRVIVNSAEYKRRAMHQTSALLLKRGWDLIAAVTTPAQSVHGGEVMARFRDIPQFTRTANYQVDIS